VGSVPLGRRLKVGGYKMIDVGFGGENRVSEAANATARSKCSSPAQALEHSDGYAAGGKEELAQCAAAAASKPVPLSATRAYCIL